VSDHACWRRASITWGWALINTGRIVAICLLLWLTRDLYQPRPLVILAIIGTVAFALDVFLYDYYKVIRPKPRRV
jgi:hypothetical protein